MRWIGRFTKDKTRPAVEPERGATPPDAGSAPDAAATAVLEELAEHIVAMADGKLTRDALDASAPLFDYGYIDSLSSVSLLELIRERYRVDVAEVELVGRLNTLDALARFVAAEHARAS